MTVRRQRITIVFSLFACLFLTSDCVAGPPTVEEVLTTYRDNLQKLNPLHVQMTHTQEWTEAYRDSSRKQIEFMESAIKMIESGSDELKLQPPVPMTKEQLLESMRSSLESTRKFLDNLDNVVPVDRLEVFINGSDYQIRTPLSSVDASGEDWTFPEAPLTAGALLTDYSQIRIYSRSSQLTPPARIWPGSTAPGSFSHALQTAKHFLKTQTTRMPPLMNAVQPSWHEQHPIDVFYSQPAERYHVAGVSREGERLLTIVEVAAPAAGNLRLCRAWLDLASGAIPVKMHMWVVTEGESFDDVTHLHPYWITTTNKLMEIEGGAFYPAKTVAEQFNIDPKVEQPTPEQWAEVRAGKRTVPFVVHERETWECQVVDKQVPDDEDFFVLIFPEGQAIFDLDTEKVIGALENKPVVRAGQPAPPLTTERWLDDKEHTLEEFRGRVVVLDFWGLWCGACRNAVPALKQLQQKYTGQPVTFVSIHTADYDPDALAQRISDYAKDQQWDYLAAIDAGTMIENSVTSHEYGVSGYPTTVIVGPDGIVTYNSDVLPEELQHLAGVSCDEELAPEDQAKLEAFQKAHIEAAGETWPLPVDASSDQLNEIFTRVKLFHLSRQIDAALKKRTPPHERDQ